MQFRKQRNELYEQNKYFHTMSTEISQMLLTTTSKVANKSPSNVAHSVSDKYLTMSDKNW